MLASLSACHKLWYLHLCAAAGIAVVAYRDEAVGTMAEEANGAGRFIGAVLRPTILIRAGGDIEKARRLHHDAHLRCFIANSVNFPLVCEPDVTQQVD